MSKKSTKVVAKKQNKVFGKKESKSVKVKGKGITNKNAPKKQQKAIKPKPPKQKSNAKLKNSVKKVKKSAKKASKKKAKKTVETPIECQLAYHNEYLKDEENEVEGEFELMTCDGCGLLACKYCKIVNESQNKSPQCSNKNCLFVYCEHENCKNVSECVNCKLPYCKMCLNLDKKCTNCLKAPNKECQLSYHDDYLKNKDIGDIEGNFPIKCDGCSLKACKLCTLVNENQNKSPQCSNKSCSFVYCEHENCKNVSECTNCKLPFCKLCLNLDKKCSSCLS